MYGVEAFLDAASVAAQDEPNGKLLSFDISKYARPGYPLLSPCNIHIRGMAPGASLIGVQLASMFGNATESDAVRGIEYAVTAGADVIDETFGVTPYPDTNIDPISLANVAAVAAGVSVVWASGDGGSGNTISLAPPEVIAVGASTSYRVYAQFHLNGFPLSSGGYLNDNSSSFSSGEFTQTGPRTLDIAAPGDFGGSM